jgi:hypothetical protein
MFSHGAVHQATNILVYKAEIFNTNSLAYYRGLVFLRGIEHVLNINFGMNMSVSCYSGVYYLYFTLPTGIAINAASISKVYVSVLIFDVGYFQIKKNFII